MTRSASILTALLLPGAAPAAAAPPLLVLDSFGEYAARIEHRFANPRAALGYSNSVGNVTLIARTHDICARVGMRFGLSYHLRPGAAVNPLRVLATIQHPPLPGRSGGMQTRDDMEQMIGPAPGYSEWYFEYPSEVVAGEWRITISHDGATELDETFHVRTACGAPIVLREELGGPARSPQLFS